ncbi:Rrf2 family transcriptional regulator [Pacificoceanicola onchidii]|uniref:RrF2 family transcriptional regulator n=1 Tax=Pacificoceanicola onchidii TaxID=2562685 RepID=UPI0030B8BC54
MRMASDPSRPFSTAELADEFGISRNHLTKAVRTLANAGIVETRRGTGGGAVLAQPPERVSVGRVVAILEARSALVECFQADGGTCVVTASCRLKGMLEKARSAFIPELDQFTLADCPLDAPTGGADGRHA